MSVINKKGSCVRLIFIIFISLFFYSCDNLNYRAHSIQSESYLKLIVSNYQRNSPSSIDGYFVDGMVNGHIYEEQLNKIQGSETIFFYQSHEYFKIFSEKNNPKALALSLEMIERAINADPENAFNYFFKSFLHFKKGEKEEANLVFIEGLGKPKLRTYQEEGCYYFALFLKKAGVFQPNNAVLLLPYIIKLYINPEFHLYIANKLLSYIESKDNEDNEKVGQIFCSLASKNKKIFGFIEAPQRDYFLYVIKKHSKEKKHLFPCSHVDFMESRPGESYENLRDIIDEFRIKKDLKILENSEYWKTMEEILR